MKTKSFIVRLTVAVLLAAAILAFASPDVQAGKLKVWAADFKPVYGLQDYGQYLDLHVYSGAGLRFFAMIQVPKDTVITKLSAIYKGSNTTALAEIYLYRVRWDGSEREEAHLVTTDGDDTNDFVTVSTTSFNNPGYVVKGKDRYMVYVYLQNSASEVRGVKITYQ